MMLHRTKSDLHRHLENLRKKEFRIGFVPTMGALHQGHLSLVERSVNENNITVVSIFVNPTQFDDPSDLEKYPRTLDRDLELLQARQVDVVFLPSVEEMYPEPDLRTFDLGGLDHLMEGAHRPGHFNGVAQIVSKLFEAVRPHRAYFGQKDFQQLVIVRHLARQFQPELKIIACPIVREPDGLAMSSRNTRLTPRERQAAPTIFRILGKAGDLRGSYSPGELKSWVARQFEQHPEFTLEYFEIVEDKALRFVESWSEKVNKVGCIAVLLGGIRLIDNMNFD